MKIGFVEFKKVLLALKVSLMAFWMSVKTCGENEEMIMGQLQPTKGEWEKKTHGAGNEFGDFFLFVGIASFSKGNGDEEMDQANQPEERDQSKRDGGSPML